MGMMKQSDTTGGTLAVSGLWAGYGKAEAAALRGVDLTLRRGQVMAVVGANGCGKSTLLRCVAGLLRPERGQVLLDGAPLLEMPLSQRARTLTLLPQQPLAPEGLTVAELVAFGRRPHQGWWRRWSEADEAALAQALRDCDLVELAGRRLDRLSGGQRQRAWLAMVLAQQTPWLLLDEPTNALDLGHQHELLCLVQRLARAGRGVLMVLHDLSAAARHADSLLALHQGEVVAMGPPREVVTPALLQRLYGLRAQVVAAPGDGVPLIVPVSEGVSC
jgi:iron complex transport system ATP-binding protein